MAARTSHRRTDDTERGTITNLINRQVRIGSREFGRL